MSLKTDRLIELFAFKKSDIDMMKEIIGEGGENIKERAMEKGVDLEVVDHLHDYNLTMIELLEDHHKKEIEELREDERLKNRNEIEIFFEETYNKMPNFIKDFLDWLNEVSQKVSEKVGHYFRNFFEVENTKRTNQLLELKKFQHYNKDTGALKRDEITPKYIDFSFGERKKHGGYHSLALKLLPLRVSLAFIFTLILVLLMYLGSDSKSDLFILMMIGIYVGFNVHYKRTLGNLKKIITNNHRWYNFFKEDFCDELELEKYFWDIVEGADTPSYEVAGGDTPIVNEINQGQENTRVGNGNPHERLWLSMFENKKIFQNFYEDYKTPEYINFGTTEVHIFDIPIMTVDNFSSKMQIIQNKFGKRIYKIHNGYEGQIGKIGIEFENEELPSIIGFDESPEIKGNRIPIGKAIKDWVTWDVEISPHTMVVGATGGGKSNTMNYMITQSIKAGLLPIFVDFKEGQEFGIYAEQGYEVIYDRENFIGLVGRLVAELEYRSTLNRENKVKNLNTLNKKYIKKGLKPLPRIVVFLDEYADVNSIKDEDTDYINTCIGQLLAKARAIGIHLVIGTQRPDAKTIGSGAFRDNITCRIIGKMNSKSGWGMALGLDRLTKEEESVISKIPEDEKGRGMFIIKGTGTINGLEVIKVPYMEENEFMNWVEEGWDWNKYSDYKLQNPRQDEDDLELTPFGTDIKDVDPPRLPSDKKMKNDLYSKLENL